VAYLQPDLASESACGHAYYMLAANAIKMAIADIQAKKNRQKLRHTCIFMVMSHGLGHGHGHGS
jgi:hypothetical protein